MVPGAIEKRVGLTAAMTVPCAATSRTKWPLATLAICNLSAEMMWLELDQARMSQPISTASTTAPATAAYRMRFRYHGRCAFAMATSCCSVPRTEATESGDLDMRLSSAIFMRGTGLHTQIARRMPTRRHARNALILKQSVSALDRSWPGRGVRQRTPDRPGGHFGRTHVLSPPRA